MKRFAFGELELAILKIIRITGRMTVRDVHRALNNQGSYTTIMTVMSRMAEKGDLKREKQGKHYIYWSPSATSNLLTRIQDKIFGGKQVEMMSFLIEEGGELSEADLNEIEQMIASKRAEKKRN